MSKAVDVSAATWSSEVVSSEVPVIVDFWAPWCGPCRMVGPEIDKLADRVGDAAKFVKVNIDENQELAVQYGVMSILQSRGSRAGMSPLRSSARVEPMRSGASWGWYRSHADLRATLSRMRPSVRSVLMRLLRDSDRVCPACGSSDVDRGVGGGFVATGGSRGSSACVASCGPGAFR